MRLDKWLWCARFYKTRRLAATAIKTGKVKVDGVKVKPARIIKTNERLALRHRVFEYEITVRALTQYRGSATAAEQLYLESEDSKEKRQVLVSQLNMAKQSQPQTRGRPDKQERRKIIRFRRGSA